MVISTLVIFVLVRFMALVRISSKKVVARMSENFVKDYLQDKERKCIRMDPNVRTRENATQPPRCRICFLAAC